MLRAVQGGPSPFRESVWKGKDGGDPEQGLQGAGRAGRGGAEQSQRQSSRSHFPSHQGPVPACEGPSCSSMGCDGRPRQPGSASGHGHGLPLPRSRPGSLGTQLLWVPKETSLSSRNWPRGRRRGPLEQFTLTRPSRDLRVGRKPLSPNPRKCPARPLTH